MAKFIKAKWIGTHPGGGVHIQGFVEYREEITRNAKGKRTHKRDKAPVAVTVVAFRSEDEEEYKAFGAVHILELGDFVVQDNKKNREILEHFVKRDEVSLDDYELQCEMEGIEYEQDVIEEIDTGQDITYSTPVNSIAAKEERAKKASEHMTKVNEAMRAEKMLEIAPFELLTNIKREREDVLLEMVDKGIKSLDDLAETDVKVLTSIKHVGLKLAEQMKKQASELLEPKG